MNSLVKKGKILFTPKELNQNLEKLAYETAETKNTTKSGSGVVFTHHPEQCTEFVTTVRLCQTRLVGGRSICNVRMGREDLAN